MKRSILVMAAATLAMSSAFANAHTFNGRMIYPGVEIFKDDPTPSDDDGLEQLVGEMSALTSMVKDSGEAVEKQFKDLTTHYSGIKADNDELKTTVEKHAAEYAEMVEKHQALVAQLDMVKKELEAPAFRKGDDKADADRELAIQLQKRAFIAKGNPVDEYTEDTENLVDMATYRSVVKKFMKVGIDSKQKIIASLDADQTKAFEAASLDIAFFSPEMLGLEVDCNIECAQIIDLYGQDSVSRSNFMYPRVNDYGSIGEYTCDAECDGPMGEEGNIQFLQGQTYDYRGVFCFQRKVLQEANYDLLAFMIRSIQRARRIARNDALIRGNGNNQPEGWLTADCFTKLSTGVAQAFTPQDFRRFLSSAPVEYGAVVATMHQNTFAYLASALDANSRFIFGDGMMTFSPDDASERIRISNCLPDPTENNTRGSAANPFVAGAFIAAAGNWEMAYRAVEKSALSMEQYEGGSTKWCVKYQFGAEDGGFVACCDAARTLVVA